MLELLWRWYAASNNVKRGVKEEKVICAFKNNTEADVG